MPLLTIQFGSEQIDRLLATAKSDLLDLSTEFIQDMNNEIIMTSPVKFGVLRGSWDAALNEIPGGGSGAADPSGGATMAKVNAVAATLTIGDIYYLVNTAVYAARQEYGFVGTDSLGRRYNQAGKGWVRAAVARAGEIAEQAARTIAGRRR